MYLIVGLGNPGKEYEKTRHNVGFLFLDFLIHTYGFKKFKSETKFKGSVTEGNIKGQKIILLKPETYMNLSGESIQKVLNFYKLSPSDIIIVYDDISMEFGKIRVRETGSSGGHNGIKSTIQYLGETFYRIKVGIGKNENFETSDWVLSKFSKDEIEKLEELFPIVYEEILSILSQK